MITNKEKILKEELIKMTIISKIKIIMIIKDDQEVDQKVDQEIDQDLKILNKKLNK